MKKLPKEYVIVEIIPNNSNSKKGFIVQLQALKIKKDKIIERLDLRVNDDLILNKDLLKMISYDKELFTYTSDIDDIINEFIKFIKNDQLLIIDNDYTRDYLKNIENKKNNIFTYLDLDMCDNVFENLYHKYGIEPSNHLVDILYESLIFEKNSSKDKV